MAEGLTQQLMQQELAKIQEEINNHCELARKHQLEASNKRKRANRLKKFLQGNKECENSNHIPKESKSKAQTSKELKAQIKEGKKILFEKEEEEEERTNQVAIFKGQWSKASMLIHKKQRISEEASNIHASKKERLMRNVKTPSIIEGIQRRSEREMEKKLTKEIFEEGYSFIRNYKLDEDKHTHIYPTPSDQENEQGMTKVVTLADADPKRIYMMFQSGLVHTTYFKEAKVFKHFPENIHKAVKRFIENVSKGRQCFLRIFSTNPIFSEEGDQVIQPAIQLCQLGLANGSCYTYPDFDDRKLLQENKTADRDFIENYLTILKKALQMKGIRINYASKSMIIWSKQIKEMSEDDIKLLHTFLEDVLTINFQIPGDLKYELCRNLQSKYPKKHHCHYCIEEGN